MEWKKVNRPPSPEFLQFQKDGKWLRDHYDEVKAQYPDQHIGVFHERVVGASPDYKVLLKELKAEGYNLGNVYFDHVQINVYPRILGSSIRWLDEGEAEKANDNRILQA